MEMNEPKNSTEKEDFMSLENKVKIIVPVIFTIIGITGVTGNISVIVIAKRHRTNTLTHTFVTALAFADITFILLCATFGAVNICVDYYPFGNIRCKIYGYATCVFSYVSIYFLCSLSFERFLAIVYPLKSIHLKTMRNVYICLSIIVVFSIAMGSPVLLTSGLDEYFDFEEHYLKCNLFANYSTSTTTTNYSRNLYQLVLGCIFFFMYCIPVLVSVVLNSWMFVTFRKKIKLTSEITENRKAVTQHATAAKTVLAAELLFILCWTPMHVYLIDNADINRTEDLIWNVIAQIFCYSSSCLNPILYTYVSKKYRLHLKSLIKRIGLSKVNHL